MWFLPFGSTAEKISHSGKKQGLSFSGEVLLSFDGLYEQPENACKEGEYRYLCSAFSNSTDDGDDGRAANHVDGQLDQEIYTGQTENNVI